MFSTIKKNPNEMAQFTLMKELKKNLEDKASKAAHYIFKNEVLKKTLNNINEKYIVSPNLVPTSFYQKAIKLCFYGLANRVITLRIITF